LYAPSEREKLLLLFSVERFASRTLILELLRLAHLVFNLRKVIG
jgi:hypothetical protein